MWLPLSATHLFCIRCVEEKALKKMKAHTHAARAYVRCYDLWNGSASHPAGRALNWIDVQLFLLTLFGYTFFLVCLFLVLCHWRRFTENKCHALFLNCFSNCSAKVIIQVMEWQIHNLNAVNNSLTCGQFLSAWLWRIQQQFWVLYWDCRALL